MDVCDKEQNAAVPRGVYNNPFWTFKVLAFSAETAQTSGFHFQKF